jgi:hypothetical protein
MRWKLRLPAAGLVLAVALAAFAASPAGAGAGQDPEVRDAVARDPGDGAVRPANFDNDAFDDLAIGPPARTWAPSPTPAR